MTIYPPRPAPFTCAICCEPQMDDTHRWWAHRSAEHPIPPLCRNCERTWGKALGGWGDLNRDRRITRQISALAAAIEVEAYRIQHGKGALYGRT